MDLILQMAAKTMANGAILHLNTSKNNSASVKRLFNLFPSRLVPLDQAKLCLVLPTWLQPVQIWLPTDMAPVMNPTLLPSKKNLKKLIKFKNAWFIHENMEIHVYFYLYEYIELRLFHPTHKTPNKPI